MVVALVVLFVGLGFGGVVALDVLFPEVGLGVVLFAGEGFGVVALAEDLVIVEFPFGIEVIFPGIVFSDSPAGVVAFALFPIEIIVK